MSTGAGKGTPVVNIDVKRAIQPVELSPRELFIATFAVGPILPPNAVILLAGEDAVPRLRHAVGRFQQLHAWAGMNPRLEYEPWFVIAGGIHKPPRWHGAEELRSQVIASGISSIRILIDAVATNTHEQAVNVLDIAVERDWTSLMLVASAYHMPRAYLTFLHELKVRALDHEILLQAAAVDHTPWWEAPDGMDTQRIDLLALELGKIEAYSDVASYEDGLTYLHHWEGVWPERKGVA